MDDIADDVAEIGPHEYACQNDGCWLVHLKAAGDSACDAV